MDLTKLTFKCHVCNQDRLESFIKVTKHDISNLYNCPSGTVIFNCRYCSDNAICKDKAFNHEFITKRVKSEKYNE